MINDLQKQFSLLEKHLNELVVGQKKLTRCLIIALLAGGHILTEGAPGTAKTRIVKLLAGFLDAGFQRIQFTPDLLPADLTGMDIYRPSDGSFQFCKGSLFNNLILADEINRAPAKVQSALLEAMAEKQVTAGNTTYSLPNLFIVMATQNALDHEGTYVLPDALLDRFLLSIQTKLPKAEDEKKILRLSRNEHLHHLNNKPGNIDQQIPLIINLSNILAARKSILSLHMDASVEDYIIRLIDATRNISHPSRTKEHLSAGVSSRGTQALDICSRAHAWLSCRNFVTPEDVRAIAGSALSHRLKLTFKAAAQGLTSLSLVNQLLNSVTIV